MGYRWRGFEHPELYKMINTGPGSRASDPQTMYWSSLSEDLAQVDQDLNTRLSQLGSRWEGKASASAQAGLTPLAEWAGDAETGSDVMRISTENQGEYIVDARANMPEPVEVTTQAPSGWAVAAAGVAAATGNVGPAVHVAAQAADHEAQEAAQSEAEQRAIETMRTYESSSTWNRETLGTFVAPPDVVVSTPAPQATGTASAVLIGSTTRSVRPGSGTQSGGSGSGSPAVHQQSPGTPQVNPGGSGGSGSGSGGSGGTVVGGTPGIPNVQAPPAATTPQEVFAPPTTAPNGQYPLPNQFPTNPSPTPGPSYQGGQPPYFNTGPTLPGPVDNAGDIARRAMPLRPGLPGMPGMPGAPGQSGPFGGQGGPFGGQGGPFGGGQGGALPGGGMPGGGAGAGALDGERSPSQLGRGGVAGGGVAGEGGVVRNGPGAAGAAGRGGNGVHGPAGAAGRRADGEEDEEHYSPDYLLENDDVFGDDRRVSPTVIGE
ncbi:MAG: hypothetical protein WBA97_29660 [Actinophytocola sp.]|uniref:hypothetical protein n=1 Tax=Actinophytocola sp. TaxID=1872138 RepID=UPI003C73CC3E